MLAILSAYDDNEKVEDKERVSFVHVISVKKKEIRDEVAPLALKLARLYQLKKVYLLFGEKGKIVYDYD